MMEINMAKNPDWSYKQVFNFFNNPHNHIILDGVWHIAVNTGRPDVLCTCMEMEKRGLLIRTEIDTLTDEQHKHARFKVSNYDHCVLFGLTEKGKLLAEFYAL